jgi:SAM-dependent methyltransferase
MGMATGYVHGYSEHEKQRLFDQANTLTDLLHGDTFYPQGSRVLEAGCGVGAQTVILTRGSPGASFTAIDLSPVSIVKAQQLARQAGITNVRFQNANLFALPFPENSFDHVFVCFVLEHLQAPLQALAVLKAVLKPGGTITVIEGDHASAYFHPRSELATRCIQCLVALQARAGGDSLIGRQVYPLLKQAGFSGVRVSPRMVYVDGSKPAWIEGFTRNTFIAMVKGVRAAAVAAGLMTAADWDQGINEMERSAGEDGTFCYTFFKGVAVKE